MGFNSVFKGLNEVYKMTPQWGECISPTLGSMKCISVFDTGESTTAR